MSALCQEETFGLGKFVWQVAPMRLLVGRISGIGESAIDLQEKVRRFGALTLSIGSAVQILVVAPSQAFQGFLFGLKDGEQLVETRHFENRLRRSIHGTHDQLHTVTI